MFYFYPRTKPNKKRTYGPKTQTRKTQKMQAATNDAILHSVMTTLKSEGLNAAVFTLDPADGRPVATGIAFHPDEHVVLFDLGEVCGNGPPAAKRARLEELVRALASEAREARDATQEEPQQEPQRDQVGEIAAPGRKRVRGEGQVDDAELVCDETLDDNDDEETVGDEAGYESPEPTPMTARDRERLLLAPEKQRP